MFHVHNITSLPCCHSLLEPTPLKNVEPLCSAFLLPHSHAGMISLIHLHPIPDFLLQFLSDGKQAPCLPAPVFLPYPDWNYTYLPALPAPESIRDIYDKPSSPETYTDVDIFCDTLIFW